MYVKRSVLDAPSRRRLAIAAFLILNLSLLPQVLADTFPDEVRARADSLPSGLTVMPVPGSLRAVFKGADGAIVVIETLDVGATLPEVLAASPDTPPRQIDVRVLDRNGFPLVTGAAGDTLADPSWRRLVPEAAIDPDLRDRDFALFLAAVAAMTRPGVVSADQEPELDLLAGVARAVALQRVRETSTAPAAGGSDAVTFTHTIVVTWKWYGGPLGHHSATYAGSKASTGQLVDFRYSCNHGACGPNMSNVSCARSLGGRSNALLKFPGHAGAETCPSTYGIYPTGNYHVCNDDSYVQVQSVVNNTYTGYWTCWYPPIRQYAPGCW